MNNSDERDYAEEAANRRLLTEPEYDEDAELDADTVTAIGLDATGRDSDPRFPYTAATLTDDERARLDRYTRTGLGHRVIDLDQVAQLLVTEHHIPGAYVEQTGGGTATLVVPPIYRDADGAARYTALAGPGWFDGPAWRKARATLDDFSVGPDDDGREQPAVTGADVQGPPSAYERATAQAVAKVWTDLREKHNAAVADPRMNHLVVDGNAYALLDPANPDTSWRNLGHAPVTDTGPDWDNFGDVDPRGLDTALEQLCLVVGQALHTAISAHARWADTAPGQLPADKPGR